jgi:DNA replication regulator SLD2
MEVQEREALTEKSNALRVELKIWEKEFASANEGKKASRDDIKKNPEIGTLPPFHSICKSSY